jgi:hypothetical protein
MQFSYKKSLFDSRHLCASAKPTIYSSPKKAQWIFYYPYLCHKRKVKHVCVINLVYDILTSFDTTSHSPSLAKIRNSSSSSISCS